MLMVVTTPEFVVLTDQKVSLVLLGHNHSPRRLPPSGDSLPSTGHSEGTACDCLGSHSPTCARIPRDHPLIDLLQPNLTPVRRVGPTDGVMV